MKINKKSLFPQKISFHESCLGAHRVWTMTKRSILWMRKMRIWKRTPQRKRLRSRWHQVHRDIQQRPLGYIGGTLEVTWINKNNIIIQKMWSGHMQPVLCNSELKELHRKINIHNFVCTSLIEIQIKTFMTKQTPWYFWMCGISE